jgi:hypothetical protein
MYTLFVHQPGWNSLDPRDNVVFSFNYEAAQYPIHFYTVLLKASIFQPYESEQHTSYFLVRHVEACDGVHLQSRRGNTRKWDELCRIESQLRSQPLEQNPSPA